MENFKIVTTTTAAEYNSICYAITNQYYIYHAYYWIVD